MVPTTRVMAPAHCPSTPSTSVTRRKIAPAPRAIRKVEERCLLLISVVVMIVLSSFASG